MSIITPQESTMNIMHQIPDIETGMFYEEKHPNNEERKLFNMLEVMKNKLNVFNERLLKVEAELWDKLINENKCVICVHDCCKLAETVCLWTLVIMLSIRVFN